MRWRSWLYRQDSIACIQSAKTIRVLAREILCCNILSQCTKTWKEFAEMLVVMSYLRISKRLIFMKGMVLHKFYSTFCKRRPRKGLTKFQYKPQILVRLLQITADGNCEMAVSQVASIMVENFVTEFWCSDEQGKHTKILPSDKEMVKEHIVPFIAQVTPLLRVQLGECLKTIINADYPEPWPGLLQSVKLNLQDQQMYGSLFVLRILSRKYNVSMNSIYSLLQPRLNVLLFEMASTLMCFNENDQKLWQEDPHEYVIKGYDIIEDLYSPRKRGKENLQKFILFFVEIFKKYNEAPAEYKPYRQKDGALLAIEALCDKLKQSEPYKSELEHMLIQHVFPEFRSPVGHLRAKAAGRYAHITFADQNNFLVALHSVVSGLCDPDLPVRVDSVFALRSFVKASKEFFKLMNEVENEDLGFTLEAIVDKLGEVMAPYAFELCQNLAAAFWKCMNAAEADEEGNDHGVFADVACLRAISTILKSLCKLPNLFIDIEPTFLPIIMLRMLTTDGQDILVRLDNFASRNCALVLDVWMMKVFLVGFLAFDLKELCMGACQE